jgi:hypothetical protein
MIIPTDITGFIDSYVLLLDLDRRRKTPVSYTQVSL